MCSKPSRLHPAGALIIVIKSLRKLLSTSLIPFFALILSIGINIWMLFGIAFALMLAVIWSTLYWYRFTYHVENNELHVYKGILVRKKILIPKERIQVIDLEQGILQRLFKIVAVKIETAGGKAPEVRLSAVSKQNAETLRKLLLNSKQASEDEHNNTAQHQTAKTISLPDLFIFAITSTSGLGIVATIFSVGLASFEYINEITNQQKFSIIERQVIHPLKTIYEKATAESIFIAAFFIICCIIAVLIFLWFLSVIGTMLKYGSFTAVRIEDRLQISYGILKRRQASFPIQRIQAVRIDERLLRQPLGYVSVKIESAGFALESSEKAILFPLIHRDRAVDFLQKFLPEFSYDIPLNGLPILARKRYILRSVLFVLPLVLVGIVTAVLWIPWNLFSLSLLPIAALIGWWKYEDACVGYEQGMFAMRFRHIFTRTTLFVPRGCMQSLSVKRSLLQRRFNLATFGFDLASLSYFRLVDVSEQQANHLMQWYIAKTKSSFS